MSDLRAGGARRHPVPAGLRDRSEKARATEPACQERWS